MERIRVDDNDKLIDYSVSEDATPLDPGDTSAAFGQVTYTAPSEATPSKLETPETLHDPMKDVLVPATVKELTYTDGLTSVTLDGAMSALDRWRTVPPFSGTLQNYLTKVSQICGASPAITTTTGVRNRQIVAAGFENNVWEGLKEFLSANMLEAVFVGGQIRVQDPHGTVYNRKRDTAFSKTHSAVSTAEKVTVVYRDLESVGVQNFVEFYPDHDDYSEGILSVDAGETLIIEIEVDGSVESVNQPTCLDTVRAHTYYQKGAYSVAGNDGKPILASRWTAGGGSLQVRTTSNPSVIEVILKGSKVEEYAPYQIAMTAGESSYYNSLHITGRGIRWTEREFTVYTGAPSSSGEQQSTHQIENPQILSLAQAQTAALQASNQLCGGLLTAEGDEALVGPNAGDRLLLDDAYFRTVSTNDGPHQGGYSLVQDTLIGDFNKANSGMTIAQFNTKHKGKRFLDFNERPL